MRLTYNPRRVCARVRSRPRHIQSCEYKKEGLSDEKTVVPCGPWSRVSMPEQAKDPTQVDSRL
jgi:hypothetical protein